MDAVYAMKLEQAAMASDDMFPDLLLNPISNEFGDNYFKLDPLDYKQEAVKVDPRFTTQNILRMRGTAKTIYRYLEWTSLWDDYMAYLKSKYGSVDMAYQMHEAGVLPDPFPQITHRPILRKGKAKKLLQNGEVASYTPPSISQEECMAFFKEVLDHEVIDTSGQEEPDIEWALHRKMTKEEKEMMRRQGARFRQQQRYQILMAGTAANGIRSNMDFVDCYYANVRKGLYDSGAGNGSNADDAGSIVSYMRAFEKRKYESEAEKIDREKRAGESRLYYDGNMIRDRDKMEQFEILKHLQQYAGIDVLGNLAHSVSKKRYRAIRTGMEQVGADVGLTKKERKKLKKRQAKLDAINEKSLRADQKLSEILLNNKIFKNGGTIRFEDGKRDALFDEDDY